MNINQINFFNVNICNTIQTISNLSDNEEARLSKHSSDTLIRGEIYNFFNENILNKWLEWKKILEITKEEKPVKFFDISGLIVSSKTTINSGQDDTP